MSGIELTKMALSVRPDGTYEPFSIEAWQYVGQMLLLGLGMVFAVLAILLGVLTIFKLVFARKPKKEPKTTKKERKSEEIKTPSPAKEDRFSEIPASREEDETVLVAVLTAAVAAYRSSENPDGAADGSFRVVSFKRVGGGRAWNTKK